MPGWSCLPSMVNVLPLPVWPYAKMHTCGWAWQTKQVQSSKKAANRVDGQSASGQAKNSQESPCSSPPVCCQCHDSMLTERCHLHNQRPLHLLADTPLPRLSLPCAHPAHFAPARSLPYPPTLCPSSALCTSSLISWKTSSCVVAGANTRSNVKLCFWGAAAASLPGAVRQTPADSRSSDSGKSSAMVLSCSDADCL